MSTTRAQSEAVDVAPSVEQQLDQARAFIDAWLDRVLPAVGNPPTRLHFAMRESVLVGGKRTRPLLVMLVAESYPDGPRHPELVGRMAAAVELIHCASLVHDDLPAFDDADTRRGRPSCHAAFGEPTAILVGDALLTLAFETIASAPVEHAARAMKMARLLAEATGSRAGIIGGQGLELQTNVDIVAYHSQKTSSLFRAAAAGGAIASGHDDDVLRWSRFGELLGHALQLRDDLDDCVCSESDIGKPAGQDAMLGRPNAVESSSVDEVKDRLTEMVSEASALLGDPSDSTGTLRSLIALVAGRHVDAA
jgi:geranylgeranyl diphosphate synthase type II